jgi:hypothetical protein
MCRSALYFHSSIHQHLDLVIAASVTVVDDSPTFQLIYIDMKTLTFGVDDSRIFHYMYNDLKTITLDVDDLCLSFHVQQSQDKVF